jgi:TonB-linked SusC/RagA family outer membrane protein
MRKHVLKLNLHRVLMIAFFFVALSQQMWAQKQNVSGTVLSDSGEPLPGVTILTKESKSIGTVTDFDGNFMLSLPEKVTTLIFTYVGFEDKHVVITGKQNIKVMLAPANNELEEVVVVGYGTQRRQDVTGAITSVKAEELDRTVNLNLGEALQGKVSGLQVLSEDGTPGGGFSVKIRGASSISGSAEPLYVVDGFPIEVFANDLDTDTGYAGGESSSPLDFLDAALIESIEVLKDASATAIYGARGANGVVIITTKKGKQGDVKINYSVSTSLTTVPKARVPDMMNTSEIFDYRVNQDYYSEANRKRIPGTEEWSYEKAYDEFTVPHPYNSEREMTKSEWNNELSDTDWMDEVLRLGVVTNHVLGISGGSDQVLYNYSLSYLKNEGVVVGSGYDRFVLNMNLRNTFSEKFFLQTTFSPSYSKQYGTGGGGGAQAQNSWGFFTRTLATMPYVAFDDESSSVDEEDFVDEDQDDLPYFNNPLYQAENEINNNTKYGLRLMTKATYTIFEGLRANIDFGLSYNQANRRFYSPASFGVGALKRAQGRAIRTDKSGVSYTNSNILNYNTNFGDHRITATAGYTQQSRSSEVYNQEGNQFEETVKDGSVEFDKAGSYKTPKIRNQEIKQIGILARANYVYDNKYSVTATIRRDGDSRFNADSRYRNFPSAALAWTISKENFMANATAIDNWKLRFSAGSAGNSGTRPNDSRETFVDYKYEFGDGYYTGGGSRLLVDENLTWQTTNQYDFGSDISLFKKRISFVTDIYYRHTKDLILDSPLAPNTGYVMYRTNAGELANWGLELALNTVNVRSKNFEWSSSLTMSFDRSNVIDLNGPQEQVFADRLTSNRSVSLIVGENIGTWTGYKVDGLYDSWAEIEASSISTINGRDLVPGDPKYVDLNGDGEINLSDIDIIADTQPLFYGGLYNNIKYKNFGFSFFLNFKYNYDVVNGDLYKWQLTHSTEGGNGKNQFASSLNAWSPDNTDTTVPGYNNITANGYLTSNHIEDGSHIRLQNVSFTYDVSKKLLEDSVINSIRLAFNINNVYLWTKYSGTDPDNSVSRGKNSNLAPNLDYGAYPRARAWNTTLKIGF